MKQFKIRCSAIGSIMTKPREKLSLISKTTQSYIELWLKEQIYNRKKEFTSKFTEKGLMAEDNSIEFASKMLDWGMVFKNEKFYENDWICGTPDIIMNKYVVDIKNSWDCFTFPLLDTECPNDSYYWQLQGYMALTGKDHAKLVYVLSDTPMVLIQDEIRRQCWKLGYIEPTVEFEQEIIDRMTYSDIDDSLKIKVFDIDRSDLDIDSIYKSVENCRTYIKSIIK